MLTVEAPEEDAAVCAGRDEGEAAAMAHSSNGAMWQRFLKEVRAAARNIASNKDPPYQVAWAWNLTEMNVPPGSGFIIWRHPPELASRAVLADDSLKRSDSWYKPRELRDGENSGTQPILAGHTVPV
jgi:hypothetical protein